MNAWLRLRAVNAAMAARCHRGEAEHLRAHCAPGDSSAAGQIAKSLAAAQVAERDAEVYGAAVWREAEARAAANLAQAGADLEAIRGTLTERAA